MYRMLLPVVAVAASLAFQALAADPAPAAPAAGQKKLFHVVSLKFKPDAAKDQITAVEKAFRALKDKIPGILSLDWGTNVSPEHKNKGFTHCFVLTFAGEAERDVYLDHAEHKAFGKIVGPVIDDVMVIDFWAEP